MRISDWSSDVCSSDLAADVDPDHAILHAVVQLDHLLWRARERRMWAHFEDNFFVPSSIDLWSDAALTRTPCLQNPRQEKVFESVVDLAVGPRMPAEAVETYGVGGVPAPFRLRSREGLEFYFFRLDRKKLVKGKRVSVRVDIGCSRILKK